MLLIHTMIQVTSSLVVTSDKINACSVYTWQAYRRAVRVSVAPHPRDQLNAKDAEVTSLPNWYWLESYMHTCCKVPPMLIIATIFTWKLYSMLKMPVALWKLAYPCENYLLIGQTKYYIIFWTIQRGCMKNCLLEEVEMQYFKVSL